MRATITTAVLLVALGAGGAQAQHEGPYVGIKAGGYSFNNLDTRDDLDDTFGDYAWGGYAGYRFAIPIAVEIEYLTLEEDNVLFGVDYEGNMFAASVKPTWDIGEHFEIYAKLGWTWMDGDLQSSWHDVVLTETSVKNDEFLAGVGMATRFGPVHMRLEYQFNELETHYFDDADTEYVTLGLAWEF